jgi:hypothetical protein
MLCKHFCQGNILQNDLYQINLDMPKACFKINIKYYFYKVYSLILKEIILKALILFDLMQISPLAKL